MGPLRSVEKLNSAQRFHTRAAVLCLTASKTQPIIYSTKRGEGLGLHFPNASLLWGEKDLSAFLGPARLGMKSSTTAATQTIFPDRYQDVSALQAYYGGAIELREKLRKL